MKADFSKKMYCKLLLSCLFFTFVSFSEEIHTIGVGFTRDAALQNALKHGLGKKIKAYIPDHSYRKNRLLINREFIENVSRYILMEKVISIKECFSCFQIEVIADIDNLALKENLTAHGFVIKSLSKPGIIVLIDEYHNEIKRSEHTATHVLKKILLKNGYNILNLKPQSAISADSSSSDMIQITNDAHLGFENSADLVIRGFVNTGKVVPVDVYGKKQLTAPVQLNIEVIRTDNAMVIASNTHRIRKNATNEFSALQFALKSAAESAGRQIVVELDAFCESKEYSSRHFDLIVNGINYVQTDRFESNIKKLSCIKDVKRSYLEEQKAVYRVLLNGALTEFRTEMSSGIIPGLAIESMKNGRIVAVYKGDSVKIVSKPAFYDVEITSFQIEELYPSKFRYYTKHPVCNFNLSCSVPVSDIQVRLSLPELIEQPFRITRNRLNSGENKIDLYIVPVLEKLANNLQTRIIQGELFLQYSIAGIMHTRSLTFPVTIYGINGMNWDHPETISSFITGDDMIVKSFSRQAIQGLSFASEYNKDLLNAIAVHTAIKKYGIQYAKDPSPASEKAIDMVQYPAQTLFHRTGDCDDLSVLYCSLLASLGIPVALLSYDDHVFFMFNTGVYEKNRLVLSPDSTLTIIHNKKLWIPIEATDMHSSFGDNWHSTARKFHDVIKAGREVQIIDIQEAWKLYPPVSLFIDKIDVKFISVKDEVEIQVRNLQDVINRQYVNEISRLKSIKNKTKNDQVTLKNQIGLLHVRSGNYKKALKFFKKAYHTNHSPKLLSNYACALLLSGKEKEALTIFNKIYKEDNSGKIAINRAVCKYVSSRDNTAIQNFHNFLLEAVSVIGPEVKLSEILGFDITGQDSLRGFGRPQSNDVQKLDISILKQYIKTVINEIKQHNVSGITTESLSGTRISGTTTETSTGTTADNTKPNIPPFGGLRGAAIEDLFRLIDLLYWYENLF